MLGTVPLNECFMATIELKMHVLVIRATTFKLITAKLGIKLIKNVAKTAPQIFFSSSIPLI